MIINFYKISTYPSLPLTLIIIPFSINSNSENGILSTIGNFKLKKRSAITAPELINGSPSAQIIAFGPILRTIVSSNTNPNVVVPIGYGNINTLFVTLFPKSSCVLSETIQFLLF